MLDIKKIFLQTEAKKYARTNEILNKYPTAEIKEVKSHWNIPELNDNPSLLKQWNKVKKEYLVIGVKSGMTFQKNGRSTDFIPPSISNGCAMACTYCYVARRKGYANPVTTFINIEQIQNSIIKHAKNQGKKMTPNQCDPKYWTYDIGCNNDVSVDSLISNNVKDLVSLFKQIPNAKATFATKYVNREMLDYDPQQKSRIRFSLMPPHIAKLVDVRCSPIKQRAQAIDDFCKAGYEVHLNFSPVIAYSGWEQDYIDLMYTLDFYLSRKTKKQIKAEVIFLTHNKDLHELNNVWHPKAEKLLWTPENQEAKTSIYGGKNLRYAWKFKNKLIDNFKQIAKTTMPYMELRYIF